MASTSMACASHILLLTSISDTFRFRFWAQIPILARAKSYERV